jgi:GNAT superfamily N-acetyltransferase
MLVKLYALPPLDLAEQAAQGVTVRRAIPPEKHHVLAWVRANFSEYWASETDVAFSRQPPSVWLATLDATLIGFACWDATARGFLGPMGVGEAARGKGTGTVLLLAALHDMHAHGYLYGIIGAVGPVAFYESACGATVIPESTPAGYTGMLRKPR